MVARGVALCLAVLRHHIQYQCLHGAAAPDRIRDAILEDGWADVVRDVLTLLLCVAHRDAEPAVLDHPDIVPAITDRGRLLERETIVREERIDARHLRDALLREIEAHAVGPAHELALRHPRLHDVRLIQCHDRDHHIDRILQRLLHRSHRRLR